CWVEPSRRRWAAGHGTSPAMYSRTSRPSASIPSTCGAPVNPRSSRCRRSECTDGVQRPVGRRTVAPTRTTSPEIFPPGRRSTVFAGTWWESGTGVLPEPMAEEPSSGAGMSVIVVGDVAHVVVDVVLDGELFGRDSRQLLVHVRQMTGGRLGTMETPNHHRHV